MAVNFTIEGELGGTRQSALVRYAFVPLSLLLESGAIILAAVATWSIWHQLPFGQPSGLDLHLRLGAGAAIIVVCLTIARDEYRLAYFLAQSDRARRVAVLWNVTFLVLFVAAFAMRRTEDLSRGAVLLFYVAGFAALWGARALSSAAARMASRRRLILARRVLIVGTEAAVGAFMRERRTSATGAETVGSALITPLGGDEVARERLAGELRRAVDLARRLAPDDVHVAIPWSETETIESCVEAFLTTPVGIHLAPERILERFAATPRGLPSLELTRPRPALAMSVKRALDLSVALVTLLLLAPLFAGIALLIRLGSPGPAFFLQTRYGFNQRPFRIIKFRTMTTYADGPDVPQATLGDARITRLGRFLRRTNLDELPQLINVVMGDMSLVGPRPHAVPHNRDYEGRIALYARRHNVKPGITGWAQVNGLRGETDTEAKMRARVEHDLFYIDNWSMLFDLKIALLTVFSAKAYRNAC